MNLIEKIRISIGKVFLRKEVKKVKRNKKVYSFASATSFGILYFYQSDEEYQIIENFIHQLKAAGKSVKALVFIKDEKKLEYIPQKLSVDYISRKYASYE